MVSNWFRVRAKFTACVATVVHTVTKTHAAVWNHIDLVTPEVKDGGIEGLAAIAKHDFDNAVRAGVKTVVIQCVIAH